MKDSVKGTRESITEMKKCRGEDSEGDAWRGRLCDREKMKMSNEWGTRRQKAAQQVGDGDESQEGERDRVRKQEKREPEIDRSTEREQIVR